MSIRDNLGGGITAARLYDALQYSGLVTEDMSAEEMLAALADEYPAILVLYENKNLANGYTFYGSGDGGDVNFSPSYASFDLLRTAANNTETRYARGFAAPKIKVDGYKKIKFTVTYKMAMGGTSYHNKGTNYYMFGLASSTTANAMISGGGKTLTYQTPQTQTLSDIVEVDISTISGEYYVGAIFKAQAQTSGGNGIDGQMSITKIELSA